MSSSRRDLFPLHAAIQSLDKSIIRDFFLGRYKQGMISLTEDGPLSYIEVPGEEIILDNQGRSGDEFRSLEESYDVDPSLYSLAYCTESKLILLGGMIRQPVFNSNSLQELCDVSRSLTKRVELLNKIGWDECIFDDTEDQGAHCLELSKNNTTPQDIDAVVNILGEFYWGIYQQRNPTTLQ